MGVVMPAPEDGVASAGVTVKAPLTQQWLAQQETIPWHELASPAELPATSHTSPAGTSSSVVAPAFATTTTWMAAVRTEARAISADATPSLWGPCARAGPAPATSKAASSIERAKRNLLRIIRSCEPDGENCCTLGPLSILVVGAAMNSSSAARGQSFAARRRSALPMTLTDESDIAAAAMIGLSRIPKNG